MELNLAAVASRSSLFGALLRTAAPSTRHFIVDFLRGLSRDEMECLAEFQGACLLESVDNPRFHGYELLRDFFDPSPFGRWQNPDERAHKMLIVIAWLDLSEPSVRVRIRTL